MAEVDVPPWLRALPQAPEFHPTEAEFQDPVAYILKIEQEAKQYGICKIIPPFTKASKKVVTTNLNRSLAQSHEASSSTVHGSCAPVSRSMGGVMVAPQLAKPKGPALDAAGADVCNKAKFATRRQQLGWNPKRARGVAHSQNHKLVWQSGESYTLEQFEAKAKMFSRSRLGTCKDVSPLSVESLFWRAAADKPISVEYANDIPGSAFAEPVDSVMLAPLRLKKRKRGPEEADQRNLDSIGVGCRSEEKCQEEEDPVAGEEVESSEVAKQKNGAVDAGGDNAGCVGSKLAHSAWNMRNVARSHGSLLRFMPDEVPGVTSPMVYIGMLFSWFAWHVEDHELHSLNYLHMGASKTWYAVPGDAAPALEEAVRMHGYGGHLDPRAAFALLGEKTTVMSPEVLVAAGVPCCRLVQNAGEYVVTFPRAYHLGFSHGFNCGEAANFATPGWLDVAKDAAARRAAMNYLPMLSHQQLLYLLTMSLPPRIPSSCPSEPRSSRLKVRKKSLGEEMVKSIFLDDVVHNNRFLGILLDKGVSRCILAKDAIHHGKSTTLEDSGRRSLGPVLGIKDSSEQALPQEPFHVGVDGLHNPPEQENEVHRIKILPSSCIPVLSAENTAVSEISSPAENGHKLADPDPAADKQVLHLEEKPAHSNNQKASVSLAIDWGTLPCAACGILCYATMAVVEPTAAAAKTFEPIYAAAGLGHCTFKADDMGRMTPWPPQSPYVRSAPDPELSNGKLINSTEALANDGGTKQHDPTYSLAGGIGSTTSPTAVMEGSKQVLNITCGDLVTQPGTKPSEPVNENMKISAIPGIQEKTETGCPSWPPTQRLDFGLALEIKSGGDKAPICIEQSFALNNHNHNIRGGHHVSVFGTTPDPKSKDAELLQIGMSDRNVKEADHIRPTCFATSSLPPPFSNCENIESPMSMGHEGHRTVFPQSLPLVKDESGLFKGVSCFGASGDPREEESSDRLLETLPTEKSSSGVSSLQLLASLYDESSDVEDEDDNPQGEGDVICRDDEKDGYGDPEGGELLAKPHGGVGDLLTDVVGLSADVPWLSLVPATEITVTPRAGETLPLFSFSSLVEGPKSLNRVFISGGFAFVEDMVIGDPPNLGSTLTEEQLVKSAEVMNLDVGTSASSAEQGSSGKVTDIQELYQRINSQALTVGTLDDEELLRNFGSRPYKECLQHEEPSLEFRIGNTQQNASVHGFGSSDEELSHHPEVDKNFRLPPVAEGDSRLVVMSPPKECVLSSATAETMHSERLREKISVCGGSSITSSQDGGFVFHGKEHVKDFGPHPQPAGKSGVRACKSVARPRVLCLEHAVEAQVQLHSVGGAHIVIVCHSDFDHYEHRAKDLAEEFGFEYTWKHIPFSKGSEDEVHIVSTAVDVEDDDGQRVNDWVMQMGLFVHHRFKERESESSDDTQNVTEDFRAGPFSRVKPNKSVGSRPMAGRVGISHKSDCRGLLYSGKSKKSAKGSKALLSISKKKKCMVAGKWCGRVWRVNQVHPFLGGCRTVDPSLQLGMSSTSLYALSVMSEWEGGKYRKVISSNRMEASPDGHLVPLKSVEDQQSIAARRRNRKRKILEDGVQLQPDILSEVQMSIATTITESTQKMFAVSTGGNGSGDYSSSPLQGIATMEKKGADLVDDSIIGREVLLLENVQDQFAERIYPSLTYHASADQSVGSFSADLVNQYDHMLSPVPLATRSPTTEDGSDGLNFKTEVPTLGGTGVDHMSLNKYLPVILPVGGNDCIMAKDKMKTVEIPFESPDVKSLEFHQTSPELSYNVHIESGQNAQNVGCSQQPISATSCLTLPATGRIEAGNNEVGDAKCTPADQSRVTIAGKEVQCLWRDVPVACAPSFHPGSASAHPLISPGHFTNRFLNSFSNNNNNSNNYMYIPYVSSSGSAVSSQSLVKTSQPEIVYSEVRKTFGSFAEEGLHLMGAQNEGHLLNIGSSEVLVDLESSTAIAKCSPGQAILDMKSDSPVQVLARSTIMGFKRRRDRNIAGLVCKQDNLADFGAKDINSGDLGVPLLLEGVSGSDHEVKSGEGPPDSGTFLGSISEQVECDCGISSQVEDVKDNVTVSDREGQPCLEDEANELSRTGDPHVYTTVEGTSSPVNSQRTHRHDCLVYRKRISICVIPSSGLLPAMVESVPEATLVGSGVLGFLDDGSGQGGSLEHPLENLLPLPTSSRGRTAVKARGKRAKHVGWTNYKQVQPKIPGEQSPTTWESKPQAYGSGPAIFSVQPVQCVEARFEAEDCEKGLEMSAGPRVRNANFRLRGSTAEEDGEEKSIVSDVAADKPKKKGKPKKKKVRAQKPGDDEDGEFQCDLEGCRMSFSTDAELQIHKRNRCTFKGCGKRFFMHKYLLQHRRVHLDERPLKCPWKGCKQAFKWAWARTEHIRVHTGERPYVCPDCDLTFRFVSDFSRHKRTTGHTKS